MWRSVYYQFLWKPFPYPEGLPVRRLSFVQWFRSSVLQSRYPEPECYHCKQREGTMSSVTYCTTNTHILLIYRAVYCHHMNKTAGGTSCQLQSRCVGLSEWPASLMSRGGSFHWGKQGIRWQQFNFSVCSCLKLLTSAERQRMGISLKAQGKVDYYSHCWTSPLWDKSDITPHKH